MRITQINSFYTISSQIEVLDVAAIAKAGFGTILCNRPDGEGGSQPYFRDLLKEAERHGISAAYLPVPVGTPVDPWVEKFGDLLARTDKPIIAYCHTGRRSAALYEAWQQKFQPAKERLPLSKAVLTSGALAGGGEGLADIA